MKCHMHSDSNLLAPWLPSTTIALLSRNISPEQQPAIHKVFVLETGHERIGTPFAGYRQQAILTAEERL